MVVGREDKVKDYFQVSSWASGVGRAVLHRRRRNRSKGKDDKFSCGLKLKLSVSLPSGDVSKPLNIQCRISREKSEWEIHIWQHWQIVIGATNIPWKVFWRKRRRRGWDRILGSRKQ